MATTVRVTQFGISILYQAGSSPGVEQITAACTASATVGAELTDLSIDADILGTGTVDANISGTVQLVAAVSCTATVDADLSVKVLLTSAVAVSATVGADVRLNIQYVDASISASATVAAEINVPWKGGTTLNLIQSVEVNTVLSFSLSQTIGVTDVFSPVYTRNLEASNTVTLAGAASAVKQLPTKTSSSTLTLIDEVDWYRPADSYIVLQQVAAGEVYFLTGEASSTLTVTQTVSYDGTIVTRSAESTLSLTQAAVGNIVTSVTASNTIELVQNVLPVQLDSDPYTILQAPYTKIQTSVAVPNPLLDDTENLVSDVIVRRSMNGTTRTLIKTSNSRRLKYTFTLSRYKALELQAFFKAYSGAEIRLLNWKGEIWKVRVITNPIDFVQTRRYDATGARTDVNLEFEGIQINA